MGLGSWGAHQLAEFVAVVTSYSDEASAIRGAVEHAAEALEAEVGAFVRGGAVVTAIGFPSGPLPECDIIAAARGEKNTIVVPGAGESRVLSIPFEDGSGTRLVLARMGTQDFQREEDGLVRGMARVLMLTLNVIRVLEGERAAREERERQAEENARLADSLSQRQRFLVQILEIQRAISHRAPLQEVLDSIVAGAAALTEDEIVGLRLIDQDDPNWTSLVSSFGFDRSVRARTYRSPITMGAGGKAILEGGLVVVEDYAGQRDAIPSFVDEGVRAAMAAPVHIGGRLAGSLTVATRRHGRRYTDSDRQMLLAFAENASLALTDAKTVEQIDQAFRDPLTGLPNRALFLDRLDHSLARVGREGARVAVLFVDLDRFKIVNDTLGHAAGDQLLIEVAQRIRSCLRPSDTAARLGGDEFALIIEGIHGAADVVPVAERLMASLAPSVIVAGRDVATTASVGIAVGGPDVSDAGDLLRNADLAMYRAKTSGGGSFMVFEQGMYTSMIERIEMEADLRRAVDAGEFVVHYQPLVRLDTGRQVGVEALVRWAHPAKGLILPSRWIPLAEESGLILRIGEHVLERACRDVDGIRRRLGTGAVESLHVNLSTREFQRPDLIERVSTILARSGLDPRSLVLEMTETAIMQDTDATVEKLHHLKDIGLRLAIDDFGTGYSSLSYLRRFPVDILKIDKSFVDGTTNGAEDSALARAIIRLGNTLNLETIAEGVETVAQADQLVRLGCGTAQGFLFGRAIEAGRLEEMLAARVPGGGAIPRSDVSGSLPRSA